MWPEAVQLHEDKLIYDGKLCIPILLTGRVLPAHHAAIGHVGAKRLWREAQRWYLWVPSARASDMARQVCRQCEVCQACSAPHVPLQGPIRPTPVPASVGKSMAIDIFALPATT